MFARASSVFVLALPVLAVASVLPRNGTPSNQCNTGSIQCCDSTQSATSSVVSTLLGLLGIPIGSVTGLVGVTCSPITVIGASGTSCSAQPVCCTDTSFNGVIATGCTPINLNL
ncbi:fungal hydrophobin-domain-containing protein [Flammula alnicola]|nr:fungal hydrophobin-domain-containing protein [Flammula alnicola]